MFMVEACNINLLKRQSHNHKNILIPPNIKMRYGHTLRSGTLSAYLVEGKEVKERL